MPFTASYTVSQAATGESLTITDTSNYAAEGKETFSNRAIRIYRADGTMFPASVEIPFTFAAYPTDTITITGVDNNYALRVELILTPLVAQGGSVYTASSVVLFSALALMFLYEISQEIALNNSVLNKANYYANLQAAFTELNNAEKAVEFADHSAAQGALNRFNYYVTHKTSLFN